MSPAFSVSAALQSIMPAPVVSRRSLTIAAVIVVIARPLPVRANAAQPCRLAAVTIRNAVNWKVLAGSSGQRVALFGFRGHRLGLGYPAIGPARKSDLFADLVR